MQSDTQNFIIYLPFGNQSLYICFNLISVGMRKLLMMSCIFVLFCSALPKTSIKQTKDFVLVCNSRNATVYHKDYKYSSEYCAGLKNCKHQIIRVLKSDASLTKRACKHCW